MTLHKRERRRWGRWVALVLLIAVAFVWCSDEDAAVASVEPRLPPPEAFEPTPELALVLDDAGEAEPQVVDAAASTQADAGPALIAPRPPPDVEAYMQRWRDALAPLFVRYRRGTGAPTLLRAMPQEAEPTAQGSDAGASEPCQPRVQHFEFSARARFDLLVVVDTSGSMWGALPQVARWLGELEHQLVSTKLDMQLLVIAEQVDAFRRKADGGYNLKVGSTDALEVLIKGARQGADPWTNALRPRSELHVIVVTDDESSGNAADQLTRLTEVLGGGRFTMHLLGGLATGGQLVLPAAQPLAQSTCVGEGLTGLQPGAVYQAMVRATNGLRASLCLEAGRRQFSEELLGLMPQTPDCGWIAGDREYRVEHVEASGPQRAPTRLLLEHRQENCRGARGSYRVAGPILMLCEDTCAALKSNGYDAVEVALECVK